MAYTTKSKQKDTSLIASINNWISNFQSTGSFLIIHL